MPHVLHNTPSKSLILLNQLLTLLVLQKVKHKNVIKRQQLASSV
jgi:hypothetical protein